MDVKQNGTRNHTREMKLEVRNIGEGDAAAKEVRVSVSSEAPVAEYVLDAEMGEWVHALEVLGHADGEIDMTRAADGLVIQDTHFGDQIGLIREVEVKDKKLGGVIEFCSGTRAQEIKFDAERGLRRNMSVGYIVNEWRKIEDGDVKTGKLPTYRAVSWTPYEASFVNVPADVRVGVDRAADMTETNTAAQTAANTERNQQMAEPVNTPAVEKPAVDNAADMRALKEEIASLRTAIKKPEMPTAERAAKPQFDEADSKKIVRQYDLMKVVRSLADKTGKIDAGFEREISDEIAKQTKREAQGFFIPEAVLMGVRAFDKTNNAGGLVATDTLYSEMVPALVAKTVLGEAGVRTISGLVGDVEIPSAGAATSYWVTTEGGNATETDPAIGQVKASPKTIGAYTDITRKLMNQSGVSAQAFVADALRSSLARGIELAAFSGSGDNGAPLGLDAVVGVNEVATATNPGLAKILEFVTKIEEANADTNGGKFVGRPSVWALLGSTIDYTAIKESSTTVGVASAGKYLLDTMTSKCQGYDFLKSNLATAKKLYFGDWSKMVMAFWSGLDLTVDTASLSKSGGVRLVALQDMDVVVTQPKAFSFGTVIA